MLLNCTLRIVLYLMTRKKTLFPIYVVIFDRSTQLRAAFCVRMSVRPSVCPSVTLTTDV